MVEVSFLIIKVLLLKAWEEVAVVEEEEGLVTFSKCHSKMEVVEEEALCPDLREVRLITKTERINLEPS